MFLYRNCPMICDYNMHNYISFLWSAIEEVHLTSLLLSLSFLFGLQLYDYPKIKSVSDFPQCFDGRLVKTSPFKSGYRTLLCIDPSRQFFPRYPGISVGRVAAQFPE